MLSVGIGKFTLLKAQWKKWTPSAITLADQNDYFKNIANKLLLYPQIFSFCVQQEKLCAAGNISILPFSTPVARH